MFKKSTLFLPICSFILAVGCGQQEPNTETKSLSGLLSSMDFHHFFNAAELAKQTDVVQFREALGQVFRSDTANGIANFFRDIYFHPKLVETANHEAISKLGEYAYRDYHRVDVVFTEVSKVAEPRLKAVFQYIAEHGPVWVKKGHDDFISTKEFLSDHGSEWLRKGHDDFISTKEFLSDHGSEWLRKGHDGVMATRRILSNMKHGLGYILDGFNIRVIDNR